MVTHLFKKSVLATALVASALASASPAMADSYGNYRRHDDTGKVIAAAVAGVVIGAVLNSNRNARNGRCVTDRNGYSRCYRTNTNGAYNNGYNRGGYNQGGYYQGGGGYNNGYYQGGGGYNQGGYYQQGGGYNYNGGYYQNDGYGGRGRLYNHEGGHHHDFDRRDNEEDD